jgi:hypothetical protein
MAGKRANGEGNIRRRANGLWEVRLTTEDGRRLSHYTATRAEADAWLTKQKRNRDCGLPLTLDEKTPLGTYLEDWLVRVAPTISRRTPTGLDRRDEGLEDCPLGIAHVARIGFAGRGNLFHTLSLAHLSPFKTVS